MSTLKYAAVGIAETLAEQLAGGATADAVTEALSAALLALAAGKGEPVSCELPAALEGWRILLAIALGEDGSPAFVLLDGAGRHLTVVVDDADPRRVRSVRGFRLAGGGERGPWSVECRAAADGSTSLQSRLGRADRWYQLALSWTEPERRPVSARLTGRYAENTTLEVPATWTLEARRAGTELPLEPSPFDGEGLVTEVAWSSRPERPQPAPLSIRRVMLTADADVVVDHPGGAELSDVLAGLTALVPPDGRAHLLCGYRSVSSTRLAIKAPDAVTAIQALASGDAEPVHLLVLGNAAEPPEVDVPHSSEREPAWRPWTPGWLNITWLARRNDADVVEAIVVCDGEGYPVDVELAWREAAYRELAAIDLAGPLPASIESWTVEGVRHVRFGAELVQLLRDGLYSDWPHQMTLGIGLAIHEDPHEDPRLEPYRPAWWQRGGPPVQRELAQLLLTTDGDRAARMERAAELLLAEGIDLIGIYPPVMARAALVSDEGTIDAYVEAPLLAEIGVTVRAVAHTDPARTYRYVPVSMSMQLPGVMYWTEIPDPGCFVELAHALARSGQPELAGLEDVAHGES